jgi:hypothetical protein
LQRSREHTGRCAAARGARAVALAGALAALAAWAAWGLPSDVDLGLPAGQRPAGPPDSAALDRLATRGLPFAPGERLVFSIEYGIIKAGTATLDVRPLRTYRGRSCYHIASTTQSAPFFDSVYKVRDRIDTLIDAARFVTWQYRKTLREGGYKADHEAVYDHAAGRARYADGKWADFPPGALDALGAFYFTRTQPLVPGTSFYVAHHADKKSFYLQVRVLGRERIKVPAGTFDCVALEPLVRDAGPFRQQGRMTVWVTDDERRLPVLMKSKVAVGSIDAVLQQFQLGVPAGPAPAGEAGGS